MYQLLGITAFWFIVAGYIPYIITTLKRKTVPNRTTWLVVFVVGTVSFFTYQALGAVETLGVALANVVGPFLVFLLSLKYGEGWTGKKDLSYLFGSGFALFIWGVTGSALIALICNLAADFLGFFPTIKKSYFRPESEDLLSWFLFVFGGIISLFALREWTFSLAIYPLYIAITEGIVLTFLLRARLGESINKIKK